MKLPGPSSPRNESMSVEIAVTIPTFPTSISHITMRRRTGWPTTASASLVVKPTPVNAERAWKRADSRLSDDRV